jgi:hypothetical protein
MIAPKIRTISRRSFHVMATTKIEAALLRDGLKLGGATSIEKDRRPVLLLGANILVFGASDSEAAGR